ncbi:hypothetical protein CSQ94_20490 [Janthinobacterium sp. BJB312]|nr:hypothetical protein CSQ94_20490 [Janthinobacterium sp. BJB312]
MQHWRFFLVIRADTKLDIGHCAHLGKRKFTLNIAVKQRQVLRIWLKAFNCPTCQCLIDGTLTILLGKFGHQFLP